MGLALAGSRMTFAWDGAALFARVQGVAADALADCAAEGVERMKADPEVPYDKGALQDSLRVAPPGYTGPDDAIIDAGLGSRHPAVLNGVEGVRRPDLGPSGGDIGFGLASGSGAEAASVREFVAFEGVDPHVWVGSFLYYSYWVHQGYFNVLAQRRIAGRPYVTGHAEDALRDYPRHFRARWAASYGGGR